MALAPDRLLLSGGAEHFDFLRGYDEMDIALDTFPYNGGTTTTEALWQGVPVLTFNGDRWASRTSRSLLLAAGLPEWVATDAQDFVSRAINLAQSENTLACWLLSAVKCVSDWVPVQPATAGLCAAPSRGFTGITRI